VEKFFRKWLFDMGQNQGKDGAIYGVIPTFYYTGKVSTAWADAATVCPWEMYRAYGNLEDLRERYPMMKKWVEYMHNYGEDEFLWVGAKHYGDWLAMDAGEDYYMGATQTDLIASAYFYYSTTLTIKAGKALGEDTTQLEELQANIRKAFREEIPGTTKLIIAQRIASVQEADMIIVLDNGQVSDVGNHEELLARSPIYQEVYYSQQKGGEE
jgi:alpha-L-rhamnosidase